MDRAVSAPRSASGAPPPQRGNWGANRGYSVLYSLKNAASRVKFPLIKTWRLNLLCTSLRPAWDHTHSASLEPGLPLQLAPRSGAEDFSCGDAVDVWPRRFRRGGQPPPHLRFARRDENYLVRGPVPRGTLAALGPRLWRLPPNRANGQERAGRSVALTAHTQTRLPGSRQWRWR